MQAQKIRLYNHVDFLTRLRPYRNYLNLKTLEKVCSYIKDEFKGLEIEEQKWKVDGNEYTNVIATYNKEKQKRLIVGAHYDVCGDQPGADDNASAVAGLLETARMVAANRPQIDYRIDFVAYCLEEPPFFGSKQMGSYVHAESLHKNNVDVIGMMCYEMIGYFSDEPESQEFPSPELAEIYPHTANFIIVVGIDEFRYFTSKVHKLMASDSKIDVQLITFPEKHGLAGMSDQRSYWKFGYDALMINDTSFVRNPHYHKKSDTIDTLDFEKMTEVVNSSYKAVTNIL